MSRFNTSIRKEDMSLRLRAQNLKYAQDQTKRLEEDNRKMEERLKELKMAMIREKEERERQGGGFWGRGQMDTGSLTNYASEVLQNKAEKCPKESKKKRVKILQDEPLELPKRTAQPGTVKYIAQRRLATGGPTREKQKGPKCGQCEDRTATLTCVQCSEIYCPSCFAAFHLKGALKQHRSIPLSASGPRVCMSPRTTGQHSPRGSDASGVVPNHSHSFVNGSEAAGASSGQPQGSGGSQPSLLEGDYDESQSAASFQQAVMAWRQGELAEKSSPNFSSQKSVDSHIKSPIVAVDESTGMPEQAKIPEIKFKSKLSYAERLMLKRLRRTELAETSSLRSGSQSLANARDKKNQSELSPPASSQSNLASTDSQLGSSGSFNMPHSPKILKNFGEPQEAFKEDEDHIDFQSIFEAVTLSKSPDTVERSTPSNSSSGVSVHELFSTLSTPVKASDQNYTNYVVKELSPFESWQTEHQLRSGATFSNKESRSNPSNTEVSSHLAECQITELRRSNDSTSTTITSFIKPKYQHQQDHSILSPYSSEFKTRDTIKFQSKFKKEDFKSPGPSLNEDLDDLNSISASTSPNDKTVKSVAQRPKSSKSRSTTATSKTGKSAQSLSVLGSAGHLTKAPSAELSHIAKMAQPPLFSYNFQSPLDRFFLIGVEREKLSLEESKDLSPAETCNTARSKSRSEKGAIKVSNRLYQMAPRSWRPDSSLGDSASAHDVKPNSEWMVSYSHSRQAAEWQPVSGHSGIGVADGDAACSTSLVFGDEMFTELATETLTPRQSQVTKPLEIRQEDLHGFGMAKIGSGTSASTAYQSAKNMSSCSLNKSSDYHVSSKISITPPSERLSLCAGSPLPDRARRIADIENSHRKTSTSSSLEKNTRIFRSIKDVENLKLSRQNNLVHKAVESVQSARYSRARLSDQLKEEPIQPIVTNYREPVIAKKVQAPHNGATPTLKSALPNKDMTLPRQNRSYFEKKHSKQVLARHESDTSSSPRPSSSTFLPSVPQGKLPQNSKRQLRPSSSSGHTDSVKMVQPSLQSVKKENSIVTDLMMSRVHEDGWMNDDLAHKNKVSFDYDDGDEITPASLRSQRMKMLSRQSGEHWETEVQPFSGFSIDVGLSPSKEKYTHGAKKAKSSPSSRPTSAVSQRSGRESRAVVMDGEDLSLYDNMDISLEQDMEDKQALDQLEWELASDTGGLTADGQISRICSAVDTDEHVNNSPLKSAAKPQKMSLDKEYDIAANLLEDERRAEWDVDEFDLRRSGTLDEDEVRALR